MARAFPPEHPEETPHLPARGSTIFYRLLRPELLQRRRAAGHPALSSDALSRFGGDSAAALQLNEHVRQATRFLVGDAVPALARDWALETIGRAEAASSPPRGRRGAAAAPAPDVLPVAVTEVSSRLYRAGTVVFTVGRTCACVCCV